MQHVHFSILALVYVLVLTPSAFPQVPPVGSYTCWSNGERSSCDNAGSSGGSSRAERRRPKGPAEIAEEQGHKYYENRRWAAAEQAFREALRYKAGSSVLWYNVGLTLNRQQRYSEALEAFESAVARGTKNRKALQMRDWLRAYFAAMEGARLARAGDYIAAESNVREALRIGLYDRKYGEDLLREILELHGRKLLADGNYAAAESALLAALEIDDRNGNVWYALGRALEAQKRYRDARKAYHQRVKLDPTSSDGFFKMGLVFGIEGSYADAEKWLLEALKRNRTSTTLFYLGLAAKQMNRPADAERWYREAAALSSEDVHSRQNLVTLFKEQQRLAEAIPYLRDLAKLLPNDERTQSALAYALEDTGQYDEAGQRHRDLARAYPNSAQAALSYGTFLAQRGNFADAVLHLQRANELHPNNQVVLNNLQIAQTELARIGAVRDAPNSAPPKTDPPKGQAQKDAEAADVHGHAGRTEECFDTECVEVESGVGGVDVGSIPAIEVPAALKEQPEYIKTAARRDALIEKEKQLEAELARIRAEKNQPGANQNELTMREYETRNQLEQTTYLRKVEDKNIVNMIDKPPPPAKEPQPPVKKNSYSVEFEETPAPKRVKQ